MCGAVCCCWRCAVMQQGHRLCCVCVRSWCVCVLSVRWCAGKRADRPTDWRCGAVRWFLCGTTSSAYRLPRLLRLLIGGAAVRGFHGNNNPRVAYKQDVRRVACHCVARCFWAESCGCAHVCVFFVHAARLFEVPFGTNTREGDWCPCFLAGCARDVMGRPAVVVVWCARTVDSVDALMVVVFRRCCMRAHRPTAFSAAVSHGVNVAASSLCVWSIWCQAV